MASPPFKLITTSPGDTDIVSVFPALDRGDKGIIQSWLLTDHNVDGTHTQATMVQVGTLLSDGTTTTVAPTPASARTAFYRDTDGALKTIKGDDNSIDWVGNPPGTILFTAASQTGHLPGLTSPGTGEFYYYLYAAGQAVSRTTFARLFTVIGTTYGSGDGSTTFNVPDLQARQIVGQDGLNGTTGRISVAGGNFDATVLGGTGGSQNVTLTQAQLPAIKPGITITDLGHVHLNQGENWAQTQGGGAGGGGGGQPFMNPGTSGANNFNTNSATSNITAAFTSNLGSGNSIPDVDPAIVLKPIIRW